MPIFQCSRCGCAENTALGDYWMSKADGRPVKCSECSTGTWHGRFPKEPAAGWKIDDQGFLWRDNEFLPKAVKIVGTASATRPAAEPERPTQAPEKS